jgi:hypothetical protein
MTYLPPASEAAASTPLRRANAALIRYPRFNTLLSHIELCRTMSQTASEPQCMILEGVPGAGKSTLVKSYVAANPPGDRPQGRQVPVVYVETPSPATVKGLAAKLLEGLGDPAAHHGALWAMNSRLGHFMRTCAVQMVILDDFHHLIDTETDHVLSKVSDWLKVLIKETNVPFMVVGVPGTIRRILDTNAQLSRLFAIRETLPPLQWDSHTPETTEEFTLFMAFVERMIGIPLPTELDRADLLVRIHYATDGVVGNIMNLLRYAIALAPTPEPPALTLKLLAEAFTMRLAEHTRKKNPFAATVRAPFVPPAPRDSSKTRELSATDVLTTR